MSRLDTLNRDLAVMRIQDSRIARQGAIINIVNEGPASVTFAPIVTPDPTSSTPSFVIQTPSPNAGISRTLRLHAQGALTVTGTNLNLWNVVSAVALRQNPLQSVMSSCNLQLNDLTCSLGSLYLMANPLANCGNTSASMKGSQSAAPSRPDCYSSYLYDVGSNTIFESDGDNVYCDSAVSGRTAQITSVTYNTGFTQCVLTYDIYENLIISPLQYTDSMAKSIYGINTMTININYANFHRMLSWAPIPTLTVASVANRFIAQDIQVSYCVPHDNSLVERPLKNTYEWTSVQYYSTTIGGAFAPGSPLAAQVNAVEFATIPSKLIVYVSASATDLQNPALSLPDFCCAFTSGLSVTFGQRAGLLSGATPLMVWDIYRRNGGNLSYPVWAGLNAVNSQSDAPARSYSGGPIILDCSADLSLPSGVTSGLNQRIQFALNASFVNQTNLTLTNPRIVVIALTTGMINIKDGQSMAIQGNGLTLKEVADAKLAGIEQTQLLAEARKSNGFGGGAPVAGSWFTDALSTVAHIAAPIAQIAHSFGSGLIGGRKVSRAQMARY